MRKIIFYFLLVISVGCISACRQKLSPGDYKNWVENPANGYSKKIFNQHTEMNCLLQPRDYAAAKLYFSNPEQYKDLDEAKKDLGENSYFLLRLSAEKTQMEDIGTYVFFGLEEDIKLVYKNDTLDASYFLAEPYDGVTPYQNITVGFPILLDSKKDFELWMDSNAVFHQQISISYGDRNKKLPAIKL